jgi:outer membrane protein
MRIIVFIVFCLNLLCSSSVDAQTLKSVLESTYTHNTELKAARERLKTVDEYIMGSLSRWLPRIEASKYKENVSQSSVNKSGIAQSIVLQQNLFHGGSDLATFKMAQALVDQGRADLLAAEQKVLLSAVDVYMKTLQSEEEYRVAEQRLEDSKKFLEFTEKRFKAGEGTRTDVAQAQASMSQAQSFMVSVSSQLEILKVSFFDITGVRPLKLIEPEFDLQLPETLDIMTQLTALNNPEIVKSQKRKEEAEYNVDKIRGEELLPSVTFKYSIQDNRQNPSISAEGFENPGVINRGTMVSLNIPIFNGGASWSNYRKAKRQFQEGKYLLMNAQSKAKTIATQYWSDHESKKQMLVAMKDALDYSSVAYEGMKKEERAGLRSVGDVIIARNTYFDSYRQLLKAKTDQLYSGYEVAAQIGKCNAKDLNLNVKLYDPFKNYNIIKLQLIGAYNPPQ